MRGTDEIDALISEARLPPGLAEAVRQAVAGRGLPPSDRILVAREMIGHFEDGLDEGAEPTALLRRFGDPRKAAAMIARARRPLRRRVGQATAFVACLAFLAGLGWAGVALSLRQATPATRTSDRLLGELAALRGMADRARTVLEMATTAEAAGDASGAAAAHSRAIRIVDSLAAHPSALARIEAAAIFPESAPPVDVDAFGAWLEDYLDRVYSAEEWGGRLTAEGLRVVRAVKGNLEAPVAAVLLEPVYFAAPADGAEARGRARRLLALAREAHLRWPESAPSVAFESELAALGDGPGLSSARLYPLVVVMRPLRDALRSQRLVAGTVASRSAASGGAGRRPPGGRDPVLAAASLAATNR